MTTRERQHIEVAKLERVERAESGRVREGAFDAFVLCSLFFFVVAFVGLCGESRDDDDDNYDDEIVSRSIRALSSRFSATEKAARQTRLLLYALMNNNSPF